MISLLKSIFHVIKRNKSWFIQLDKNCSVIWFLTHFIFGIGLVLVFSLPKMASLSLASVDLLRCLLPSVNHAFCWPSYISWPLLIPRWSRMTLTSTIDPCLSQCDRRWLPLRAAIIISAFHMHGYVSYELTLTNRQTFIRNLHIMCYLIWCTLLVGFPWK